MHRNLASLVALATIALTVGVGCPEEPSKPSGPGATPPKTGTTGTPTGSAAAAAPKAPEKPAAAAAFGTAVIKGVVEFTGKAPEMKVPVKRKDADVCKDKDVKYNAVLVKDGKLKDTFVRIEVGGVKGKYEAPKTEAVVDQVDCMYTPRIQGVVAEQEIKIKNGDQTLHNVHTFKGSETLFNQAQPKGSDPITKNWEDGIVKFKCDVHPWMTGFVIVTDHPFFAVSKDDGSVTIEKVPAGKYKLEAWHSQYGLKTQEVTVEDGKTVDVKFTYDGTEAEPAENKDELKGLW
jgi:plastocyanin